MSQARLRCQDERWGIFTESDDGESHCEEQRTGRVHCVMFHPGARGIKAPPVDHREPLLHNKRYSPCQIPSLQMSEILLWL